MCVCVCGYINALERTGKITGQLRWRMCVCLKRESGVQISDQAKTLKIYSTYLCIVQVFKKTFLLKYGLYT